MGTVVIKDLSDNVELDRKAMQAISGGARVRSQAGGSAQAFKGRRIVDFRTGGASKAPAPSQPASNKTAQ